MFLNTCARSGTRSSLRRQLLLLSSNGRRVQLARSLLCVKNENVTRHLRSFGIVAPSAKHTPFASESSFVLVQPTHQIQNLSAKDIGKQVVLHGYLGSRVDLSKNVSFVPLLSADLAASIQIISAAKQDDSGASHAHATLRAQTAHSPVAVRGVVQAKEKSKKPQPFSDVSRHQDIEVSLAALDVFNKFPSHVTFEPDTVISADQRHLQLRQSRDLRQALRFRTDAMQYCRRHLSEQKHFLEVETPLLFKSTPEGAREFIVPTRKKAHVYALPQSPQQYKQILMASGIPKYFQFAKCFRDEDLRADRQPEFTQLDLEMAFASSKDVMECVDGLIRGLWDTMLSSPLPSEPLPVMSYDDAMSRYGSDKPDLRLGMEIARIGHMIPADLVSKIGPLPYPIVEAFKLGISSEPQETRTFISRFMDSPEAHPFVQNPHGQPGIFVYDPRKPLSGLQPFGFEAAEQLEDQLALSEGDMVVIQARPDTPFTTGSTALGNLRLSLHRAAVTQGLLPAPTGWRFLWVNNFPLFLPSSATTDPGQGGQAGLSSAHHPFTSPATPADVSLLATDPLAARADHFDLVLNGIELGGGSRRIHDPALQAHVLRDVLRVGDARMADFAHLLDVLGAGCPPHAGIALGFDRLCAAMLGKESIRDVIAFPKSGRGEDLLVKSPGRVSEEQLRTYHLRIVE